MSDTFAPSDAERDPAGVMFTPIPREVVLELHAMVQTADALLDNEAARKNLSDRECAAFLYQQVQARALVTLLASMVIDGDNER